MLRTITLPLVALALAAPAVAGDGCSSSKKSTPVSAPAQPDIVDTAIAAGSFKTLAAALQAADLVDALRGDGPFTVFAPTDEAFAKLPEGTVEALLKPENKARIQAILLFHVASGEVPAKRVVKLSNATTLNGQRAAIATDDHGVTIAGARVVRTDVQASNGIIHVIDTVMMPTFDDVVATAKKAGKFRTLLAAAQAAGLAEALMGEGPFTVFAPTDDAFAALPEGTVEALLKPENRESLVKVLKYHVVSGRVFGDQAMKLHEADTLAGESLKIALRGETLTVGGAAVVAADVQASNGVIHVVDAVLMPPSGLRIASH